MDHPRTRHHTVNRCFLPYLLSAPAALLLAVLLAGPLVLLARVSLYEPSHGRGFYTPGTGTFDNFAEALDAHGLRLLGDTVVFGCGVAAVAVLLAYPLALVICAMRSRDRTTALALVLLPKLAGPLVVLLGLQYLLSANGPVNRAIIATGIADAPVRLTRNVFGAMMGEVSLILPYAVLILVLHLRRIDPALRASARGLGASPWQAFWRVTWPLSWPGLFLAGHLALLWGMGAFLGPTFLGGPDDATLSGEAHRQAFEYGRWPRAAAASILLLAATAAVAAVYRSLARRMWEVPE